MRRLTGAALDAGAFGLSTGLVYPPGYDAGTDEIVELVRVAAARGAFYASHIRREGDRVEQAAVGARADLVAFDADRVSDVATFDDPQRFCDGVHVVVVNGRVVAADGEDTGVEAGAALLAR